jgi:hypothetical protein
MTLDEAIENVIDRPRNKNLHYYVCKWNTGYCINTSSYMKRNPHVKFVYSTEKLPDKQATFFYKI